jgi:hypothetical protein
LLEGNFGAYSCKGQGKFALEQVMKAQIEVDVQLYYFFNLGAR